MGDFAKSTHKSAWKESMFKNYEKMNTSGTFSALFLRKDLPPTIEILKAQSAFKVKLQEEKNMTSTPEQLPIDLHKFK
eukprot:13668674-Ditylum_brightwellii.AAC.1